VNKADTKILYDRPDRICYMTYLQNRAVISI
jgi:hypothetical protein